VAEGYDLRLGWTAPDQRLSAAVTAYHQNVRDQIAYVDLRYVNIARTRSEGVEAEADARLGPAWRLKLAYALTDAIDETTGQQLLRVPRHTGSAALFYDEGGRWNGAFTIRAESSQADVARDGFTPQRRPGFATADLAGAYKVNDQLTLTARIENLADKRYEETLGFNESGRAVYVGVRLRD
jgi:vitamin B12 transporter